MNSIVEKKGATGLWRQVVVGRWIRL